MTAAQERSTVVTKVKSREGKNQYTQSDLRTRVDSGYSDCSALQRWAYLQIGIEIGTYTGAQIEKGEWVTKGTNAPNEALLLPGDLLFFSSASNNGRAYNVGHVEMYVGNGQISGHGSGIGPTRKNMIAYSQQRNASGAKYIGVKRYIKEDGSDSNGTPTNLPNTTSGSISSYQRWVNTYYAGITANTVGALLVVDSQWCAKTYATTIAIWKDLLNRKYGLSLTPSNTNFGESCKGAASKAVIRSGSGGTLVALLQGILAAKGYYAGGIDAEFGSMTVEAVKAFQKAKGLTVDGIAGPATWYALFN